MAVLVAGLADNLAEELLPRIADIIGPLLRHPRLRPALEAPGERGGWLHAALASERLRPHLPAGAAQHGGLLQQFGGGLLGVPDMLTPSGTDMNARMGLSRMLEEFAFACRPDSERLDD